MIGVLSFISAGWRMLPNWAERALLGALAIGALWWIASNFIEVRQQAAVEAAQIKNERITNEVARSIQEQAHDNQTTITFNDAADAWAHGVFFSAFSGDGESGSGSAARAGAAAIAERSADPGSGVLDDRADARGKRTDHSRAGSGAEDRADLSAGVYRSGEFEAGASAARGDADAADIRGAAAVGVSRWPPWVWTVVGFTAGAAVMMLRQMMFERRVMTQRVAERMPDDWAPTIRRLTFALVIGTGGWIGLTSVTTAQTVARLEAQMLHQQAAKTELKDAVLQLADELKETRLELARLRGAMDR